MPIVKSKRKLKLKIIDDATRVSDATDIHSDNNTVGHNALDNIDIKNMEGLTYLSSIPNNSIDLILTDPPYIISKDSGMNEHYNNVKSNEENNIEFVKTEQDWDIYKRDNNITDDENKDKYMKYGSIYGKKYCVKTDYGEWDSEFTMEILEKYFDGYSDQMLLSKEYKENEINDNYSDKMEYDLMESNVDHEVNFAEYNHNYEMN